MIRVEGPDGTLTTYTYDPLHRRLTKTVDGVTTRFLYDGLNEIGFETNGELSLRIMGETPQAEIGAAVALELAGKYYAPIHDLQGNVAELYDPIDKPLNQENRYSS